MAKAIDINRFLPPAARRLRKLTKQRTKATADRRKRKRVSLEDINKFGVKELLSENREELTKAPDKRGAFTKFLDVIDIPRNLVANAIAKIAGVKPKQQREGAILKKVFASDLLSAIGVKKGPARAVLGFVGDVALDPLTYLGAGARTGLRLAAGTPKILKPGALALKGTAGAVAAGKAAGISDDVVRGLGTSKGALRRLGNITRRRIVREAAKKGKTLTQAQITKKATKSLFGKGGGLFGKRLTGRALGQRGIQKAEQTRKFFTKFGAKGRTIARVPFTKAGITAGRGREARLFKEFAKGKLASDVARATTRPARLGALAATKAADVEGIRLAKEGLVTASAKTKRLGRIQTAGAFRKRQEAADLIQQLSKTAPSASRDREIARLAKVAEGPINLNKAGLRRTLQAQASPESRSAFREFTKINRAQDAARKAGTLTQAQIASDAARKKELAQVMSAARKQARALPKALGERVERVTRIAEKGGAGLQQAVFNQKLNPLTGAPARSPSLKAVAQATIGRFRPTEAQARLIHGAVPPGGGPAQVGAFRKARTFLGRQKQKLFGPGASEGGAKSAGAEAAIRTRSPAAYQKAAADWATKVEPIVARLVKTTGRSTDEAQKALVDFVEFMSRPGGSFAAGDPVRTSFTSLIGQLDEPAKAVMREYGQMHAKILKELTDAGVSPGRLEDFVPRRATEQFAKIGTPEARRAVEELAYNPHRTKELRWIDAKTGEAHTALSSNAKETERLTKLFGKPQAFDISIERWNTDRALAARLQPDLANARIEMFKQTLPEAAGELARQRTKRLALADVSNWARSSGIPSEMLSNQATRGRFPGFAQVRWELFNKTPAYQTVLKGLEGQAFPQQIVDMLERFMTISAQPDEINKLLRMTDKSLSLWKGVTLAHPAYTIRNIFQNFVGNAMAGQRMSTYLSQARPGSRVHEITKAALSGQAVSGTISIAGREVPAQHFAKWLTDNNIIMSGMIGEALPNVAQAPGQFLRKLKPLQRWFALNSEIESTMKAASLWSFLDDGMDLQTALRQTARAMPDLADLTLFERNVARRLIPFYSWFRKNGALQLFHYLPKKPHFIAAPAKIKQALEGALRGDNVVPEDLRPAWMQAMQGIQVTGDEEKGAVFLAASWLPFQELIKFGSGAFDIGEGARAVAEIGRPSLRFIAEQASGQDIFRRTPIEPTSPAGALKRLPEALIGRGPLGGVLGVRPLREAFRVAEVAEQGPAAAVGRAFVGGAFQPVSKVRGLGAEFQRLRDESIKLRQQINRALQVNDESLAESLKRQYLQVLLQMHQMGLPGVPKATQGVFQQAGLQPGPPAFEGR